MIYRIYSQGSHHSTSSLTEFPAGTLGGTFYMSAAPRAHGATSPILRCLPTTGSGRDFPQLGSCAGATLVNILGYSFESTYPGVLPIYSCRMSDDFFISWSPTCEGHTVVGALGYALWKAP